jgi:hypothetical protein
MGCRAARRGAPAALLEMRQEAMHGPDIRTDEATRLQKSLKATAERACGKISLLPVYHAEEYPRFLSHIEGVYADLQERPATAMKQEKIIFYACKCRR